MKNFWIEILVAVFALVLIVFVLYQSADCIRKQRGVFINGQCIERGLH